MHTLYHIKRCVEENGFGDVQRKPSNKQYLIQGISKTLILKDVTPITIKRNWRSTKKRTFFLLQGWFLSSYIQIKWKNFFFLCVYPFRTSAITVLHNFSLFVLLSNASPITLLSQFPFCHSYFTSSWGWLFPCFPLVTVWLCECDGQHEKQCPDPLHSRPHRAIPGAEGSFGE